MGGTGDEASINYHSQRVAASIIQMHFITTEGVAVTTCACLTHLSTPLATPLAHRVTVKSMGQNTNIHAIRGTDDHNAPCAVCYASTRVAVFMLPARTSCPTGWTREDYGYLMSDASI